MKISQHIQSVIFGAVLASAIIFGMAAQSSGPDAHNNKQIGRYQVAAGSGNQAFVLDTATGEVWANYDPMFKQVKTKIGRNSK
ncbi:MAG: hypothetical protein ACO1QB_01515 [Verrucomicrobiales bacterium]